MCELAAATQLGRRKVHVERGGWCGSPAGRPAGPTHRQPAGMATWRSLAPRPAADPCRLLLPFLPVADPCRSLLLCTLLPACLPSGVDVIEAGFPVASPDDYEGVRAIAQEGR